MLSIQKEINGTLLEYWLSEPILPNYFQFIFVFEFDQLLYLFKVTLYRGALSVCNVIQILRKYFDAIS